ncbi:MAG: ribosomal protein S18-alanine N-acetyltransferase [Mariprofundaceae bacterium]
MPAAGWRIVAGGLPDLDEVHALNHACLAEAWSREGLASALADGWPLWLSRTMDGRLAGYLLARRVPGAMHLMQLVVAPEWRRRGVGRGLMRRLMEAAGTDAVELEVRASNAPAIALYASLGFARDGIRPRYYRNGPGGRPEDALLMTWRACGFSRNTNVS